MLPAMENNTVLKPASPIFAIDCSVCKTERTMQATNVPRMNAVVRVIGALLLIPSLLGIMMSIVTFIGLSTTGGGSSLGVITILFVGVPSFVFGLLGWLLVGTKKVFKCQRCGFILDRA